jgi:hypothetical protein
MDLPDDLSQLAADEIIFDILQSIPRDEDDLISTELEDKIHSTVYKTITRLSICDHIKLIYRKICVIIFVSLRVKQH